MGVGAFIFDMDGTMIDSMPFHQRSWITFCERHGIEMDVPELMRRTTGRNGAECMSELFGRPVPHAEAWALVAEKEAIYRELFGPVFAEVPGFTRFAQQALHTQLKVGVGTAGDQHNIAFAMGHLRLPFAPHAVVGGDEGLPGKPEPHIFLEAARRMGCNPSECIVFEDAPLGLEAARRAGMRAVAICTSHSAAELRAAIPDSSHILASVPHFNALSELRFLENLHVA
ncbi:MAG: hypothetical protein RLZZ126_846 [Pseudomonadota bacterium]|jgi:beta-phosphoglucomutase-like phosphatase (HAD superfamily)